MGQGGASWRPSSLRFGERRALGGVVLPPFLGDGGGGQAAGLEAREEPGPGGQTVEAVMTRADFLLVQALAMSPLSRLLTQGGVSSRCPDIISLCLYCSNKELPWDWRVPGEPGEALPKDGSGRITWITRALLICRVKVTVKSAMIVE